LQLKSEITIPVREIQQYSDRVEEKALDVCVQAVIQPGMLKCWFLEKMEMGFGSRLNVHLEIRKDKRVSCLCRWLESTDILERLFKPTRCLCLGTSLS
jgi:hypothetical protein